MWKIVVDLKALGILSQRPNYSIAYEAKNYFLIKIFLIKYRIYTYHRKAGKLGKAQRKKNSSIISVVVTINILIYSYVCPTYKLETIMQF